MAIILTWGPLVVLVCVAAAFVILWHVQRADSVTVDGGRSQEDGLKAAREALQVAEGLEADASREKKEKLEHAQGAARDAYAAVLGGLAASEAHNTRMARRMRVAKVLLGMAALLLVVMTIAGWIRR